MSASILSRRSVAVTSVLRCNGVARRGMGGGHGHGHGKPTKALPPRPALPENPTFAQKFEHTMWNKRHPDYEGIESYVRFYLPENYHLVYFVLGLYGSIAGYQILSGKAKARADLHNAPKPEAPDYHTPVQASSDIPEFGSDAWVTFVNSSEANVDKWVKSLPA